MHKYLNWFKGDQLRKKGIKLSFFLHLCKPGCIQVRQPCWHSSVCGSGVTPRSLCCFQSIRNIRNLTSRGSSTTVIALQLQFLFQTFFWQASTCLPKLFCTKTSCTLQVGPLPDSHHICCRSQPACLAKLPFDPIPALFPFVNFDLDPGRGLWSACCLRGPSWGRNNEVCFGRWKAKWITTEV